MHARQNAHSRNPLPKAYVSHHGHGRTRLRIPDKRRNAEYFVRLKNELSRNPHVTQASVNPVSASGLIMHDLGIEALRKFGEEHRLFELVPPVKDVTAIGDAVADRLQTIDERLRTASEGRFDLSSLAFVGLVGASVLQALRGDLLPPAATLLADAFEVLPRRKS